MMGQAEMHMHIHTRAHTGEKHIGEKKKKEERNMCNSARCARVCFLQIRNCMSMYNAAVTIEKKKL